MVNDIELLIKLGKFKILDTLLSEVEFCISAIKLTQYSQSVKRQIETYAKISELYVDDDFDDWSEGKDSILSTGDLSSMYVTMKNEDCCLLLSLEDLYLPAACEENAVSYRTCDDLMMGVNKDERMMDLYNLIK